MKEHKWKNDPAEYNLNAFYQQRIYVANTIKQAQWSFTLKSCWWIDKTLKRDFYHHQQITRQKQTITLTPPSDDQGKLAQEFNDFFRQDW